ncbi:MAG: ABC transporter permease [Lachnospiraceae bacterium]|nr:ABC transporter permease [Lachnospiraceae bacterium]
MLAVYKKELRAYFNSIIGWLFLAFFLAFIGIYFFVNNLFYGYTHFGYALYSVILIFILLVPMVTMRIMAEENRQKTDQLLFTSPVSVEKIILGKYFAVVTLFAIVVLVTCTYPLIMAAFGEVNFGMNYAAIFGFFLLGCAYLAIGTFISALTESQAFAAVVTFIVVLFTYLMDGIASLFSTSARTAWLVFAFLLLLVAVLTWLLMKSKLVTGMFLLISQGALAAVYFMKPTIFDGAVVEVFGWFSVVARFDDFVSGIFNVSSVVYYLSIVVLFIFLTVQAIKKRRWN